MEYEDPDPTNVEYVIEINRRGHFNNLHTKLPSTDTVPRFDSLESAIADYRGKISKNFRSSNLEHLPEENRKSILEIIEKMVDNFIVDSYPLLTAVDVFIKEFGFDYKRIRSKCLSEDGTWTVGVVDVQQDLIPLYIYLRKEGFSEQDIVK